MKTTPSDICGSIQGRSLNISYYANILQLVEDTTDNRVVASSSLAIRTKISGCRKVWLNRVPWEHELAGSNPATQTIIISILLQK